MRKLPSAKLPIPEGRFVEPKVRYWVDCSREWPTKFGGKRALQNCGSSSDSCHSKFDNKAYVPTEQSNLLWQRSYKIEPAFSPCIDGALSRYALV
jgi:hypothetical protein